jgi:putative N6-adenine-specific DNA methylase
MTSELTRGGRKLEAAVAHFGIAARLRGMHAIDVGASTGGFVSVLLAAGARHVCAIDAGHGQLAPGLAGDARVTNLERTDFKTASLTVAPGPFDVFTVDVSFVAARSMLRGLAFRLREGAEGVVLVKPQFELPSHLVKDGKVDAPALRKRALDTFAAKAERLGFVLLSFFDSPVTGGSGTVEILAHLRFAGRPESMPKVGERKPARPVAKKALKTPAKLRWFAVAPPGLEAPLCAELALLADVQDPRVVEGGVEFSGALGAGMAANLHSRMATRIVLRMGEVKARDFAPLRRSLAKLPWRSFVPSDRALRIDVSTGHCRLYHTGALAEGLELAIQDCVGDLPKREKRPRAPVEAPAEAPSNDDEDCTRILLRGQDDRFMASVDSSGALLHRRGWRLEAGRAPLRETLAAGVLALCAYDPALPLVDPMCGAGTFAIEAAALARKIPPGRGRTFAFERWPVHDAQAWQRLREAMPVSSAVLAPIIASDRDVHAVEVARRNAARAQVEADVRFAVADFGQGEIPGTSGLLVINPPYGHRLGQRSQALRLARGLGQTLLAHYRGWRAGILCPDPQFVASVAAGARRAPVTTHVLRNGGLRVHLAVWAL